MRGFYPGHSFDRRKIEDQAKRDAKRIAIDPALSFEEVAAIGLTQAKNTFGVYTDNPQFFYETYVNAFIREVISTTKEWKYREGEKK